MTASRPDDEGDEPELTPEQRERLHDQVDRVHSDLLAEIGFQLPQLDLGTSAVARIAEDMAKLSRITLSESMLRNMAGVSIFAEWHSEMLSQIKPVLNVQSALQRMLPVVNSDIFKLTGLNQGYFNTIASQLGKSADFGWTGELARFTKLYADQQAQWLKAITPALPTLRVAAFFPSNLQDVEGLGLQSVEQVVMLDGIALYAVPRAEIAEKLLCAESSSARRVILGRKWKEIAADCRAALESCQSSELAPVVRFALDAVDALERGNATSRQALSGSLTDTILRKYLSKTRPLIVPSKKTKNTDAYLKFSVRKYLALGPIWQAYQSYYPEKGDYVPRTFNRHATAHTVGSRQYSRRNAVQGLMLVCGLLKFLDEQDSARLAA
jgi:hypothetical protein